MLPADSIHELWSNTTNGFVLTMNIAGKFGLVRDRFEEWRKWPHDYSANPYDRVAIFQIVLTCYGIGRTLFYVLGNSISG